MKEYIERAAVHELVKRLKKYQMFSYDRTKSMIGISPDDVDFGMDKIPAADVVEVRHGYWIDHHSGGSFCSACKRWVPYSHHPKYCETCGARMDGKENDHAVN
jgi:hypothetical protein